MKKSFLLLLAVLLPLCVYGQSIQTNFYGIKIGKKYSPNKVKGMLLKESETKVSGDYKDRNGHNIEVEFVSFGGQRWDAVACSLIPKNNRLYSVMFLNEYHDDFIKVSLSFVEVAAKLSTKYGDGLYTTTDEPITASYQWTDSNGMSIILKMVDLSDDDGNNPHQWVSLQYVNLNLLKELKQTTINEL